jgi:isochorismate pyruvate lyase
MNIDTIYRELDHIDTEIINLLEVRSHFVVEAEKQKLEEPGLREEDQIERILAGVRQKAFQAGLDQELAERIYRTIIAAYFDHVLKLIHTGKEFVDEPAA